MKTPWYETSPGAVAALLLGNQWADADLYTFFLPGGGTLQYTTCPYDVTTPSGGPGAQYWYSKTVKMDDPARKATAHWKIGFDVDTWQVVAVPRPVNPITGATFPDTIGSTPWLAAAQAGALDGAEVQIDRAFFPSPWGAPAVSVQPIGAVTIFYGRVAEVDIGRSQAWITINSHLELLGAQMPRNLYQVQCTHTLFDAGCTLTAASFAVSATAGAGSTQLSLVSSASPTGGSSGDFTLGRVVMTSGLNAGFSRYVSAWASGGPFTLAAPLPFPVTAGDTFTAYPGCSKTFGTCYKFSNTANFGGQPLIPAPETAT